MLLSAANSGTCYGPNMVTSVPSLDKKEGFGKEFAAHLGGKIVAT